MLPTNTLLNPQEQTARIRVLLIEDDEDDFILTRTLISTRENTDLHLAWIDTYEKALRILVDTPESHDVYLVDYRLGERTGIELIKEAFRAGCKAPMILLTGQDDLNIDRSALELGAADYLVKGRIDAQLLGRSIRYALKQANVLVELSEKENKYRSLFERSIDAIFVADTQLHIRDANPSVEQLLGYTRDELTRLNPLRLFASVDEFRRLRFHVREYNAVKDFETVLLHKTGRRRNCLISVWSVAEGTNRPDWYQGIARDITEQKRAQQELIIAEKLTMTGKIARSIAHEVRNPLTNLSLSLEQLKEELPQDDDSLTLYTDIIGRNVERIGQLITEMLNSSKPRELDRQPQSINEVVQDTLGRVADRLKLKSMRLVTDYCAENPVAMLDRDQVKTALLNMLLNAVEAMESNRGVLTVRTQCTDEGLITVVIEDNGSGISEENRKRLFDPFFTGKATGMGLGLTTTQNIINGHRGLIDVESRVGQGTIFRVNFPRY
jgi:PAS domain S-box-containing protein